MQMERCREPRPASPRWRGVVADALTQDPAVNQSPFGRDRFPVSRSGTRIRGALAHADLGVH